jgi:hypothetical protein
MNIELDNIEVDVNNILLKNELLKKRETLFNIGIDFSSIGMLKGDKKILEETFKQTKKELIDNGY